MEGETNIFQYKDYRSWLSAAFASRIERNSQLSVSSLATKVGMSQSLLSLILRGKRKLTFQRADAVSEYLELSPAEKTYLHLLIQLEQTHEVHSRSAILHKLEEFAQNGHNGLELPSHLDVKSGFNRVIQANPDQMEAAKEAMRKFADELESILSQGPSQNAVPINLSIQIS